MKALALGLLFAGPAFASCPDMADLRLGITLVQNTPSFVRSDYEVTAQGLTEVRLSRQDGKNRQRIVTFAHGLAPLVETRPGGVVQTTYADDLGDLDRFDSDDTVVVTGKRLGPEGLQEVQRALVLTAKEDKVIQTCTYRVWVLNQALLLSDGTEEHREITYAPDIGVILASRHLGGDRIEGEDFAYTWIGTAADVAR